MTTHFAALINVVKRGNFVVLDSETTGLDHEAEICQLAIIDWKGKTLLDTLIKPSKQIPWAATQIHGIKNEHVAEAPTISTVYPLILGALKGRDLVIYNHDYDTRLVDQSLQADGHGSSEELWMACGETVCAMMGYAEFFGEWDDYHGNYRWQRLTSAIRQQGLTVDAAHSALGDCLMTLALVNHLTAVYADWKVTRRLDLTDHTWEVRKPDENYCVEMVPMRAPVCGCGKPECEHIQAVQRHIKQSRRF